MKEVVLAVVVRTEHIRKVKTLQVFDRVADFIPCHTTVSSSYNNGLTAVFQWNKFKKTTVSTFLYTCIAVPGVRLNAGYRYVGEGSYPYLLSEIQCNILSKTD